MRSAVPIAIVCLAAALLAGCGGSGGGKTSGGATESTAGAAATESTGGASAPAGASAQACPIDADGTIGLRVTAVSCGEGQKVVLAWGRGSNCTPAPGASQTGCNVRGYRCIATATDRGFSVDCSRPGRSVAFTAKD
ncbi:MAG TPA: hypothetical protein VMT37_01075 [Solirubrobacterales bacterium]|nr:hypothetical protein [Solirubrobacterales bacterium]